VQKLFNLFIACFRCFLIFFCFFILGKKKINVATAIVNQRKINNFDIVIDAREITAKLTGIFVLKASLVKS